MKNDYNSLDIGDSLLSLFKKPQSRGYNFKLQLTLLIFFFTVLFGTSSSYGQVNVTGASVGDGSYTTIGAAFTAISSATGSINIEITGNSTETAAGATLAAGAWTSITIAPTGGPWTISGAITAANPLINFNGSDNVTINGGGNLIFSNTTVSATSGTSTLKLIGDATNNVFNNVTFLTAATMPSGTNGGAVWISTGTATGNDNNTFESCKFTSSTSNSGVLFYANGSTTNTAIENSNVTVNNCEFYNYFLASGTQSAIYIATGNTSFSITNNKIYQTATRTITTSSTVYGIYCVNAGATALGENFAITGNTIGYNNNAGTGTMTYAAGATGGGFIGILFNGSTASTGTNNINSNIISNIQWTSSSSSIFTGISNSMASTTAGNTLNFNSNQVKNITSVTATGTIIGIFSGYSPSVSVSNNTIDNITRSGSGAFYGIQYTGASSSSHTFNANTISNLSSTSAASTSAFYGIYSVSAPATEIWTNNTIDGLISSSTAAQTVLGIYNLTATTGNKTCQNNIIKNISLPANSTGTIYGLRIGYLGATNLISGNTVFALSGGTNVYGISAGGSALTSANTSVYNNKIYGLSNSVSSAANVYGLTFGTQGISSNLNVYNNIIGNLISTAASSTTDAIRGISITSASLTSNIYLSYNTVYLEGSASSGADFASSALFHTFNTTGTTADLTIRNNIFVNNYPSKGLGVSASFKRSAATDLNNYSLSSSNNLFNGANIYFDGTNTDVSFSAFKVRVTTREDNSFSENPTFVSTTGSNANFLHIDVTAPTQIEGAGIPITTPISISDDFDGDSRDGSTPDVGADEGNFTVANNMSYSSSTTEQVTGFAYAGAANQSVIRVNVVTLGATNPLSLSQLTFNANGTTAIGDIDATQAKVYYTGSSSTFSTSSLFGSTTPTLANFVVTAGTPQILSEGNNYFWLAYDVTSAATSGNLIDGECIDFNIGSTQTPSPSAPIGNKTILVTMSGVYNIGASQIENGSAFTKLSTAIVDLHARGVSGAVTFALQSDYTSTGETFPLSFNQITGASSTNTITIKPDSGVDASITGSSSTSIIKLNGADYVTIDGSNNGSSSKNLTISNTNTAASTAAIWISSLGTGLGATDNTIKNCTIQAGNNTTTNYGVYIAGTSISTTGSGADNNNNTVQNNTISRTATGIFAGGSITSGEEMNNLLVSQNAIGSNTASDYVLTYGIRIYSGSIGATISQNEIFNMINSTSLYGIHFGSTISNSLISRNNIHGLNYNGTSTTSSMNGIYFSSTTLQANNQIDNNIIYDLNHYGPTSQTIPYFAGIRLSTGTGFKVYYNTVSLTGGFANTASNLVSSCLGISGTNDVDVRNNIFFNSKTGTTPRSYTMVTASTTTFTESDYNSYYSTGSALAYLTSERILLSNIQTATTKDANSIDTNPLLNSATNVQPGLGSPLVGVGDNSTGVTIDYLGTLRNNPPTIGAYENALDGAGPIISYTILANTALLTNRNLQLVSITDASGLHANKPRLYFKKSTAANAYVGNTSGDNGWKYVESNGTVSPFDFTMDNTLLQSSLAVGDVIQYFVVAQDDAAVSNVSINSGTFALAPSSVALTNTAFPIGGTINSYAVTASLSGTITVPGTYPSLTLAGGAFEAINSATVTGNIVIEITDDLTGEIGTVALNQFASPYTVTINPSGGVLRIISGSASGAVIKLNGADDVTIDGLNTGGNALTISNTSTSATTAVIWNASLGTGNGATGNTIKNCTLTNGSNSVLNFGISVSGATIGSTGADNDNITIQGNAISSCATGIYANGTASASLGGLDNLNINNNSIVTNTSVASIGIRLGNALNASVSQNTLDIQLSSSNAPVGISLETGFNTSTVTKNKIERSFYTGSAGYGGRGITVGTGSATSDITLSNNVIYGVGGDNWSSFGNSSSIGIAIGIIGNSTTLTTITGGVKIYNNSVNMSGDYSKSTTVCITTALYVGTGASVLDIRNNIFVNSLNNIGGSTGAGSKAYAIYSAAANSAFTTMNNNNYSVSGAQGVLGYLTSDRTNLTAIQAGFGQNVNSKSKLVTFVSPTDLHLNLDKNPHLKSAGATGTGVTVDFDGETRGATPDIGADEFASTSVAWAITSPATTAAWTNPPASTLNAYIEEPLNTTTHGIFGSNNIILETGNAGSLTIASGTSLTVQNAVINNLTDDKFVIENNANLLQINNVANTGSARVYRNSSALKRLDYTAWSSPVVSQNLKAFSPATLDTRFYTYTTGTGGSSGNYTAVANPLTTNFDAAKGYLIRMPDTHPTTATIWNGLFTGVPRNGDFDIPYVYSGGNNYYLIGNPYPSAMSADAFINENTLPINDNRIDGTLYFWRKENNINQATTATPSYASYTTVGGVSNGLQSEIPNGIIQTGQGFLVSILTNSTAEIKIRNNQRVGDNQNQFFRTATSEKHRVWINATNADGAFSQTLVGYMTNATNGVDNGFDGLFFNDGDIALTSIINADRYAIQARELPFIASDVVPLSFKAANAGSYSFSISQVDGLFAGAQDIFIKDNLSNTTHNIKNSAYNFTSDAGMFNSRFEVIYQTVLNNENPVLNANQIIVYKNNLDLVVNSGAINMASIKIFDIQGRLLLEKKDINANETKIGTDLTNDVVLLQITTTEGVVVTKKVIR